MRGLGGVGNTVNGAFAGDVLDYVKFGVLRTLLDRSTKQGPQLRLMVNWYRRPPDTAISRHREYVLGKKAIEYQCLDPLLHGVLSPIAKIAGPLPDLMPLESNLNGALAPVAFHSSVVPTSAVDRAKWHKTAVAYAKTYVSADVAFLDPDTAVRLWPSPRDASLGEVRSYLEGGMSVVVYCHHNRARRLSLSDQAAAWLAETRLLVDTQLAPLVADQAAFVVRRGSGCVLLLLMNAAHQTTLLSGVNRLTSSPWCVERIGGRASVEVVR